MNRTALALATLAMALLPIAPASADEPVSQTASLCGTSINDGTDLEHSLRNQVDELTINLSVVENHAAYLEAQNTRLDRQLTRKQRVIDRLRAALAAR